MIEGHSQNADHHIAKPDESGAQPAPKGESKIAVIAAVIGNIAVGIVKFIAAAISGSAAMLSEGIHSVVDSGNGLLVLLGMHRSKKEPDFLHPFGYGKELYFWTLVVALLIFLLGGGISIFKGFESLEAAHAGTKVMGDTTLNFIIIIIGMIIEGVTLGVGIKQFNAARGSVSPLRFIRDAKDPSLYTVVLEDTAAELGLVAALISLLVYQFTGNLYADGVASLFIGLLLCAVSFVLLKETKGLLVGEGMKHQSLDELRALVEEDPNIIECGRILTMYMGPQNLLIAIDATFKGDISAREVLIAVDAAERRIMERWPEAGRVFIEVESMRVCLDQQIQEASWEDEYEDEYEEAVEEARALPDAAADEEADVIGEAMEAAEEAAEVAAAAALAAEEAAAIAASARAAASAAEQEAAEALAEHAAEMGRQAADRAVADRDAEKIANIGSVSLESSKAVGKARKAYDKLTPEQALLVGNYDALLKAEKKLKKLKKAEKQRRKEAQAAADAIRAAANQQDD